MFDDMHGSVRERELSGEVVSLREQVRALTAERDGFKRTAAMVSEAGDRLSVTTAALEAERDALRARVAEFVDAVGERGRIGDDALTVLRSELADLDTLRARVAEVEKEREEDQGVIRVWRGRTERAESERDAAQQRAKALECAARRVTREALEALEKMPTPTKEHEALATLQRNLIQRLREETDAAMAAATTKREAP